MGFSHHEACIRFGLVLDFSVESSCWLWLLVLPYQIMILSSASLEPLYASSQ